MKDEEKIARLGDLKAEMYRMSRHYSIEGSGFGRRITFQVRTIPCAKAASWKKNVSWLFLRDQKGHRAVMRNGLEMGGGGGGGRGKSTGNLIKMLKLKQGQRESLSRFM